MRRCTLTVLFLALTLQATPAHAQDTLSVAARLVMRQPVGAVLRVHAQNQQITGVFERVDAGTLFLADPPRSVPLRAIDDAWLQRRSTMRGAKVGTIIGASGGAALFGFGALILSGVCEYECDIDGAGDIALATLFGGIVGAGSGFLVGALIGSGIPRWERLGAGSAPPTIVDAQRRTRLSAFSITPLATRAQAADEFGGGVAVSYLSQLTRNFALGPEVAIYDLNAPPLVLIYPCGDGETCSYTEEPRNGWSAGGLARIGTGAGATVEPYALVGIGLYRFAYGLNLGGYSAGGGLRVRPGNGSFAVSGEGRWHSNFTNAASDIDQGFYTVGVALSLLR